MAVTLFNHLKFQIQGYYLLLIRILQKAVWKRSYSKDRLSSLIHFYDAFLLTLEKDRAAFNT